MSKKTDHEKRNKIYLRILVGIATSFIVALTGAVPKYYEVYKSYEIGVPVAEVQESLRQFALMKKNLGCISSGKPSVISNGQGSQIRVWHCGTEVMIELTPPVGKGKERVVWLSFVDGNEIARLRSLGIAEAAYKRPRFKPVGLVCSVAKGRYLYRKFRYSDGSCWIEKIDGYKRTVIDKFKARNCARDCR